MQVSRHDIGIASMFAVTEGRARRRTCGGDLTPPCDDVPLRPPGNVALPLLELFALRLIDGHLSRANLLHAIEHHVQIDAANLVTEGQLLLLR